MLKMSIGISDDQNEIIRETDYQKERVISPFLVF